MFCDLYVRMGKRTVDLLVSLVLLLLFLPLLIILALVVRLNLGAPIFFAQQRPGLHGYPFMLYKLRTMSDACDSSGKLLSDAERLTLFGQFLRKTSLDELPTLFNVIRGDMSLVGPRPLLMHYLELYTTQQMHRHDVMPGMTGWAQVNGRNTISWEQKFALDLWYVENQSFLLDVKIFCLTLYTVFKREGISQPGTATMTEFTGTQSTISARLLLTE